MSLRCFLFSSDEETVACLRQILSGLGVEAEICSNALTAVERITNQPFQIVIIDWAQQPEAGLLLTAARERKAAERPITLAIVSDEASAPQALHAGANSLLRKPIFASQARETLTTARDLLRAKQGSAANAAAAAAASSPASLSTLPSTVDSGKVATLRAGEFLQTASLTPGEHFETEAAIPQTPEESASEPVDPLKDLEPMAASVSQSQPKDTPADTTAPAGSRGLEWYLKTRVAAQPSANAAAAPAPAPARGNPELLGYEQASSYSAPPPPVAPPRFEAGPLNPAPKPDRPSVREQKNEAELFAYIQGDADRSSEQASSSGFRLGKRAIIGALLLAACAITAAPQAPWHPRLQRLWGNGKQAVHAWLNPQPVTPPQAPVTHETFTRAGDEYKLPVAEPIPDATTDPSQIKVVPVIDPTLRKPNNDANSDPAALPPDGSAPADGPTQAPTGQSPDNPPSAGNSDPFRPPLGERVAPAPSQPVTVVESPVTPHPDSATATSPSPFAAAPLRPPQPHVVSTPGKIPSSLQSQLAPKNPTVGGNKPLEAALPSIEPVEIAEPTERLLIIEDPSPAYPANAKGQQGTVLLQVLIARDGTVQDAKFIQGSLVFARNAIDAVRQWKFKPYQMNGHPVSVQTALTIKFKPAQ